MRIAGRHASTKRAARVGADKEASFVFRGRPNLTNLGDWVIYKNLVVLCQRRGRVVIDGGSTPETVLRYLDAQDEVAPYERVRSPALSTALAAWSSRGRVFLMRPPGHRFTWRKSKRFKLLVKELGRTYAYRSLGARICLLGVTYGPFDRVDTLFQRLNAPAVHVIGVRDAESMALASRLGFRRPISTPDLAFADPVATPDALDQRRDVVLSFRPTVLFGDEHDLSDTICSRVRELSQDARARLSFVAQVTEDQELNLRLWKEFGQPTGGEFTSFDMTPSSVVRVLARYGRARLVLTNRLHVFLFALLRGSVPHIVTSLARHDKIRTMFETLHLEEFMVDLADGPALRAVARLTDAELGERRRRLADVAALQRAALLEAFDGVVSLR